MSTAKVDRGDLKVESRHRCIASVPRPKQHTYIGSAAHWRAKCGRPADGKWEERRNPVSAEVLRGRRVLWRMRRPRRQRGRLVREPGARRAVLKTAHSALR